MVESAHKHSKKTRIYVTAGIGLLLAVRAIVSVLSPAGIEWDYAQYYLAGNRAVEGRMHELYLLSRSTMEAWERNSGIGTRDDVVELETTGSPDELISSGRMGYIGFPLTAFAWAPFGALSKRAGLVVFKLGCALSLALALFLLFPAFRNTARTGHLALPLFLGIALLYGPFWFSFATGGQATPLGFLLLVLFYRLLVQNRVGWASVCLALAIPIKPFFVVILPILFLGREIRSVIYTSAGLAVIMGTSVVLFGLPLHLEWWEVMRISAGGLAEPWWNNVSILGSVYTWWTYTVGAPLEMIGEPDSAWVRYVLLAFKLVVVSLLFYRAATLRSVESDPAQARHHLVVLGVLLPLFISNIVWPHYLTFAFLPLMFWLIPRNSLPTGATVLAWLTLVSTMSVQSRFAQRRVLSLLEGAPLVETLTAVFFGSVTLMLAFVLFVGFYAPMRETTEGLSIFDTPEPGAVPRFNPE